MSSSRLPGALIAVTLHALVIIALLSHAPAREALLEAAPIMVSLIRPQVVEKPAEPPKPKPLARRPQIAPQPLPQPVLTLPAAAPTETADTAPPQPARFSPAPPAPPAAAVTAPVAAIAAPRFDADYLNNPPPRYPAVSRRLGEQGRVLLRVLVDSDGSPVEVQVSNGSGYSRLDAAALDTVKRWRFVPARQGDQAVRAWVLVPVAFTIRS